MITFIHSPIHSCEASKPATITQALGRRRFRKKRAECSSETGRHVYVHTTRVSLPVTATVYMQTVLLSLFVPGSVGALF
jgi:hypothetical protein